MITDREMASPVGRGEERGISPDALLRQTGLLAMAAGVSTFLSPILHPDEPGSAAWGPIVAFSPPIGILAVLVVGHTLFGASLSWLGYALYLSPTDRTGQASDLKTSADATIR